MAQTFLKFFLHYYIPEKLSLGAAAAATLVTLHFFLVLLVHALTAQTVCGLQTGRRATDTLRGVTDQERNMTAEHQETLHSEFSSVLGFWGVAGRVPDTLQELYPTHWECLEGGPSGCRPACQTCCWLHAHKGGRHHSLCSMFFPTEARCSLRILCRTEFQAALRTACRRFLAAKSGM